MSLHHGVALLLCVVVVSSQSIQEIVKKIEAKPFSDFACRQRCKTEQCDHLVTKPLIRNQNELQTCRSSVEKCNRCELFCGNQTAIRNIPLMNDLIKMKEGKVDEGFLNLARELITELQRMGEIYAGDIIKQNQAKTCDGCDPEGPMVQCINDAKLNMWRPNMNGPEPEMNSTLFCRAIPCMQRLATTGDTARRCTLVKDKLDEKLKQMEECCKDQDEVSINNCNFDDDTLADDRYEKMVIRKWFDFLELLDVETPSMKYLDKWLNGEDGSGKYDEDKSDEDDEDDEDDEEMKPEDLAMLMMLLGGNGDGQSNMMPLMMMMMSGKEPERPMKEDDQDAMDMMLPMMMMMNQGGPGKKSNNMMMPLIMMGMMKDKKEKMMDKKDDDDEEDDKKDCDKKDGDEKNGGKEDGGDMMKMMLPMMMMGGGDMNPIMLMHMMSMGKKGGDKGDMMSKMLPLMMMSGGGKPDPMMMMMMMMGGDDMSPMMKMMHLMMMSNMNGGGMNKKPEWSGPPMLGPMSGMAHGSVSNGHKAGSMGGRPMSTGGANYGANYGGYGRKEGRGEYGSYGNEDKKQGGVGGRRGWQEDGDDDDEDYPRETIPQPIGGSEEMLKFLADMFDKQDGGNAQGRPRPPIMPERRRGTRE